MAPKRKRTVTACARSPLAMLMLFSTVLTAAEAEQVRATSSAAAAKTALHLQEKLLTCTAKLLQQHFWEKEVQLLLPRTRSAAGSEEQSCPRHYLVLPALSSLPPATKEQHRLEPRNPFSAKHSYSAASRTCSTHSNVLHRRGIWQPWLCLRRDVPQACLETHVTETTLTAWTRLGSARSMSGLLRHLLQQASSGPCHRSQASKNLPPVLPSSRQNAPASCQVRLLL